MKFLCPKRGTKKSIPSLGLIQRNTKTGLAAVTHSAPNGVRDGPLLCFMTRERVFFAPAVPQTVMHQHSDGACKGNM